MTLNLFKLALKNIESRRTRSWLTILGVLVFRSGRWKRTIA